MGHLNFQAWRTIRYALRSWGHTGRFIAICLALGVVTRIALAGATLPWPLGR